MLTSKRDVIAALVLLLSTGCASQVNLGDLPLMSTGRHAVLHVFSPEGREIAPFDGQYIQLTGYSFSPTGVGILPGERHVRYLCPLTEGEPEIHGYIPTVLVRFEAGREYDLRCVDGHPEVTERTPDRTAP